MTDEKLKFKIAITLIPGIGSVLAKKLIAYTGSVEAVFKEKLSNLVKIPGIGQSLAYEIYTQDVLASAEKEIQFIDKFKINCLYYLDKEYPNRLKHCEDSPVMLYVKGTNNFNSPKVLSIVGTREATNEGIKNCTKIVKELSSEFPELIIVSGLAYGIDITAHKSALSSGIETIAVLGHGLDTIYPSSHKSTAQKIINHGSLVTEFLSQSSIDKNNFVRRNRIIAGLSDATIVIESGIKGGSLITANIANSYNRDVFAIPGRTSDKYSKGCNSLIRTNRAALAESASDICYLLGWEASNKPRGTVQREIFVELTENEKVVVDLLNTNGDMTLDMICNMMKLPVSVISSLLINLEFTGNVKCLPGNVYTILK